MKRLLFLTALLAIFAPWTRANQAAHGFCEVGAQVVVTSGLTSATQVQASFPACTVTVFVHGGGIASIFSDSNNTVLANPFTATTNGQWTFYAANGRYDIQMSGAGFPTPVTISDVFLNDAANQAPSIACSNVTYAASLSFNVTNNACYTVILTGALTVTTSGTPANGNILKLQLYQNAAGGNSVTFPANFNFPAGFVFQTGSNAHNDLTWIFDAPNAVWQPVSTLPSTAAAGNPGGSPVQAQFNNTTFAGSSCVNFSSASLIATGPLNEDCDTHFKGPNPVGLDITRFGGRAAISNAAPNAPGITATCTASTSACTLSSASTFQNGDYVVIYGAGSVTANAPSAPTITPIQSASQTMGLVDVNTSGGATTYCYQILARTLLGGTSVSPETCTGTGPSSLGLQTNTITSVSLSNNVATYTTSSAHTLTVGANVRIVSNTTQELGAGTSNGTSPFNCWCLVATVPDNTHFTVQLNYDSRAGAVTSGTGGTVNYWSGIKITATAATNNYEYYVYGRVTGGSKALIGIMQPQPQGTTCASLFQFGANGTCLTFDDFGTGVLVSTPGHQGYIPTTVPSAGNNADMLLTQITSGAGTTTINLANSIVTGVSGVTILKDDAQAVLAAWNQAATAGFSGSILIPSTGDLTKQFVFNAPITIVNQGNIRPVIQQNGNVVINEPILFSTFTKWQGGNNGTPSATGFSQNLAPTISCKASPCFHVFGGNSMYTSGFILTYAGPDSQIVYLQDGGGIPTSSMNNVVFQSQTGANDHSNIAVIFRGNGADIQINNSSFLGTQNGSQTGYADSSPIIVFNQQGNVKFDWLYMSGKGVMDIPNGQGAGSYLRVSDVYCQGCYMPMLSIATAAGPVYGHIKNVIEDTFFDTAILANYAGTPMYFSGDEGFSTVTGTGGGSSGGSVGPTINNTDIVGFPFASFQAAGINGQSYRGTRFAVNDGTFGRVSLGLDQINRSQQLAAGFSFFTGVTPYTAPSCVISAGGSLPTGTYYIYYAPIFAATSSEGTASLLCTAVTTTGNQTITATVPTTIPGALKYSWFISNTTPISFNWCGPSQSTTSLVQNSAICTGSGGGDTVAAGGPAGIINSQVWGQNFALGNLTNVTSRATATRSNIFPDGPGEVALSGITTAYAYDNFNRANGGLGSNWNVTNGTWNVTSNAAVPTGSNIWALAQYVGNTLPTTASIAQFSEVTVSGTPTGSSFAGAGVFIQSSGVNGYMCAESNATLLLSKVVGGTGTNITTVGVTGVAGDVIDLVATSNNGTTTLNCFRNGGTNNGTTPTLTTTDTNFTSGIPGVAEFVSGGGVAVDNWNGGAIHPVAQLDAEQDFTQPLHETVAITVGPTSPVGVPAALSEGNIYASGAMNAASYGTTTNCNVNSVSPAACGSAAAGVVVVPTTTTTYTVNTSAVTTNSRITIQPITDATGVSGSPTCNAPPTPFIGYQSGRTAGTSFTFTLPSTTGTSCWIYWIVD